MVAVALVACSGSTATHFAGGIRACRDFRNAVYDATQGVLTEPELRDRLKAVYDRASTAEPEIKSAATNVLSHVTQGRTEQMLAAMDDMYSACDKYGYK